MKNKILNKSIYFSQVFILICLISCQEEKQEGCAKFIHEQYLPESLDSALVQDAADYREILLKRFDETSIKGFNYEVYHLQFYSSHGYGKSIKFEKKVSDYYISIKCITKPEWYPDCKEYQRRITEEEWNEFEQMIYEFNFWTEEQFRANEGVLDGYIYFLEGNRPEAEKCNKRTYQFIGRGSPLYDKMGALCDYIIQYEEQLAFRYNQKH